MSLYKRLAPVTEGAQQIEDVNIVNESAWLNNAMIGLTEDIYRVMEASDIADIVGEHQVLTEGVEAEAVLESIIKGGFDKLKAAFKKFWDKIKAFFSEVKKAIQMIFLRGEKFIKEFETQIKAKSVKGYKYMSYKYSDKGLDLCAKTLDTAKETALRLIDSVDGIVEDTTKGLKDMDNKDKLNAAIERRAGIKPSENYEGNLIKMIVGGSASTTSELATELDKACRGGAEKGEREELEDFEGTSKDAMVSYVKDMNKSLETIKKSETKFDTTMSAIIKKIDGFATKKDQSDEYYKTASTVSSMLTKILNIGKVGTQVMASVVKERAGEYESILKGYLRYKPVKEGTEVSGNEEPTTENASLFQSIYDSI